MSTEPCICPHEGFCERHKMVKTGRMYELCQNSKRYREFWDGVNLDPGTNISYSPISVAASFATSMAKFLWHGAVMTSQEVYEERLSICRNCNQRFETTLPLLGVAERCRKCGCFISAKAAIPGESCPIGNWPAVSEHGSSRCNPCGNANNEASLEPK